MDVFTNAERVREVAGEYRVAYRQLQHVEKRAQELLASIERDRGLAFKRYTLARRAYEELALDEPDEYSDEELSAEVPSSDAPSEGTLQASLLGTDPRY